MMDVRTEANEYDATNPYVTGVDSFDFMGRLDDAAQYATVYRNDRPVGTLQRRPVISRTGPVWTLYAIDGTLLRKWFFAPRYAVLARGTARELNRFLGK
jgi:hypothetical protein